MSDPFVNYILNLVLLCFKPLWFLARSSNVKQHEMFKYCNFSSNKDVDGPRSLSEMDLRFESSERVDCCRRKQV